MSLCLARFQASTAKKVRPVLCWDITQHVVVISYPPFGTGPETSVRNYHYSLRNDPEDRNSRIYSFFNLVARWRGWLTPRPGRFTHGKDTRCLMYRRLSGAPGLVWTGAENFTLHRDSVPGPSTP